MDQLVYVWIWKSADGPVCLSSVVKVRVHLEELLGSGGRWIAKDDIVEYWTPKDLQNDEPTATATRFPVL